MDAVNSSELRNQLETLKQEHRDLDAAIDRLQQDVPFDNLQVVRLKKKKLLLKDQIAHLESMLLPDIIA
ncbi:YdcH family protein [Kiloniella sp. b19]|uniref:YdcH family protein n=1 Tax=Kiloniella sp. GXU_MW_B19 TaxID=3141326 RepID=UPI0031D37E08